MVHDDPIAVLERELVSAARRLGAGEETVSLPGARPHQGRRPRGAVALLLSTAVVIALALGAVVTLGGRRQPHTTVRTPAVSPAGVRHLVGILGVLRSAQTPADRPPALVPRLTSRLGLTFVGTPDLALMRFATTTPWGERLYVVPINPPTAQQIARFTKRVPAAQRSRLIKLIRGRAETLMVLSIDGAGGAGDAATIEQGHGIGTEGAGRTFAGGSTATRITLVVPDGVAKVKFVFPRQSSPEQPAAPVYPHSLAVIAPVRDNIAAVQVDRDVMDGSVPMIWYGPDGQVVKRIGTVKP